MKKNAILFLFSGLITLAIAEVVLRNTGYNPGQLETSRWLQSVDSLYMLGGFTTDYNGIFKVDTALMPEMASSFTSNANSPESWISSWEEQKWVPEVAIVHEDQTRLLDSHSEDGELTKRVKKAIDSGMPSKFDSILIHYAKHPINAEGFYSIPFDAQPTKNKKVLLLGDSFTWGHSTQRKINSFSNILLAREILVYNTGISGADVAQYKQILRTYIDSINPDVVILNFYMGNDVSYFERVPTAGIPIHYSTNAGNLVAFQDSMQFTSMQETYDKIMRNILIPRTSMANIIASKTVIGTMIWKVLVRLGLLEYDYSIAPTRPVVPTCNREIEWIRQFCEIRQIPFILSVIPDLNNGKLNGVATINHLFEGMTFEEPEMNINYYNIDDGHFNEAGHLAYADYLERLILHQAQIAP